jgi:serine/threonine-protein kinase
MLGTPYYMSPEQAQGIKSVDARSDLWSLAVIVFQCLTGRLPFESEALGDLLVKIIVSPIPTPSTYNPMVPVGFDAWWQKAADRNPDHRFPTAKAFAESLSLSLGQSSVTEVTERGRLHRASDKPATHTAMMVNAPGTEVFAHVPNTPQPGVHTAAMATPNPMHTPPGMQPPGMGSSPGQNAMPMGAPPPGHPAYAQAPQATTGNPVAQTFSGLDGGGAQKKGVPLAVYIGIGLLAVVGLGLGGFAFVKGRAVAAGGGTSPTTSAASAAVSSTASVAAADASATPTDPPADPAASAVAAKDPAAPASASASAASTAAVAPVAAGTHRPLVGGAPHAAPSTKPPVAAVTPPTAATPKGGVGGAKPPPRPNDLGF